MRRRNKDFVVTRLFIIRCRGIARKMGLLDRLFGFGKKLQDTKKNESCAIADFAAE